MASLPLCTSLLWICRYNTSYFFINLQTSMHLWDIFLLYSFLFILTLFMTWVLKFSVKIHFIDFSHEIIRQDSLSWTTATQDLKLGNNVVDNKNRVTTGPILANQNHETRNRIPSSRTENKKLATRQKTWGEIKTGLAHKPLKQES